MLIVINFNMGCIETKYSYPEYWTYPEINFNMGCIETMIPAK